MIAVWKEALNLINEGRDFCIATIVALQGSSPRHVGAKFLVRNDGSSVGTIGGGIFEAEVTAAATEALRLQSSILLNFAFTGEDAASDRAICGGSTHVLIEYLDSQNQLRKSIYENLIRLFSEGRTGFMATQVPHQVGLMHSDSMWSLFCDETGFLLGEFSGQSVILDEIRAGKFSQEPGILHIDHLGCHAFVEHFHPRGTVFIFGAGHVGVCVAHLASFAGFKVVVVDDRKDFANCDKVPDADEILVVDSFDRPMSELNVGSDSYLVIVTRGHSHDKVVLQQALNTPAQYVGMIGSKRKIKLIFDALMSEGVSEDRLAKVHSPIGLPIGGETPEEIAVSIVAQLVQVRNSVSGKAKKSTCMSD